MSIIQFYYTAISVILSIIIIPSFSYGNSFSSCTNIKKDTEKFIGDFVLGYSKTIQGKHISKWTINDLNYIEKTIEQCEKNDKSTGGSLKEFKRYRKSMIKVIESAKESLSENDRFAEKINNFIEKINKLTLSDNDFKGYSYSEKMKLLNEFDELKKDEPRSFNYKKYGLNEFNISRKIDDKINQINSEAYQLKRKNFKQKLQLTNAFISLKADTPNFINYDVLIRDGVNDTLLNTGQLLSCIEITNKNSQINFENNMFGKTIKISSAAIDNQNFKVELNLKDRGNSFIITDIDLSGKKYTGIREKLYIIEKLTSSCDRDLMSE